MSQPGDTNPYTPRFDRGGCGIGFVADRFGRSTHELLRLGLDALVNLQHRGAIDADAGSGDGAGVLTTLPAGLFAREVGRLTGRSPDPERLAVGMFFFQPGTEDDAMRLAEAAFHAHDLDLLCWRPVPVEADALGRRARATRPAIWQALLSPHGSADLEQLEQHLFLARKQFERQARPLGAYVPSCSSRTIVYKGLLLAGQLPAFYADLRDPDFRVPLVVFHQRYSTNTLPTWQRAQPFRMLCHNGEINTLQGNLAWMRAREPLLRADFCDDPSALRPVVDTEGSDSAMLDNVVELLRRGGRELPHALSMLVPPAWEALPDLPQAVRDFHAYHAGLSEPWDGPAALVFTDGSLAGATLDRNGLRPCRYLATDDGLIAAASEAGAVRVPVESIRVQGRLGPGQMLVVDTATGRVLEDGALKAELAGRRPYGEWMRQAWRLPGQEAAEKPRPGANQAETPQRETPRPETPQRGVSTSDGSVGAAGRREAATGGELVQQQAAFGYTSEELVLVLRPMVENKTEAIGSMGDDTPPAVLSDKPRSLFAYFRQRFAEVTNPPIDPLRERLVMSTRVRLGTRGNFLDETPEQARLLLLDSPFLTDEALRDLKADTALKAVTLSTLFPAEAGPGGLKAALGRLEQASEEAVRQGAQAVVLSDRGVDAAHAFVPALLALGAVHQHLLRADLRTRVDLVVESGEPREVHHFAALIGYGAAALNAYLALATASRLARDEDLSADQAQANFLHAAEHGLLKIMSKMGISTVDAYCGAQIFETIGLSQAVVDRYFTGTSAHLGGLALDEVAGIVLSWHQAAFQDKAALSSPGFYKFKRSGEVHGYSPAIVQALHAAVRTPGGLNGHWREGYAAYKRYSDLQHSTEPVDIHDLLQPASGRPPLRLAEVESAHAILWRFSTAAMSHGALSAEAHATLAAAMNRLDALSNGGEGGEDPARYAGESNDRIKQVASARFGVTPAYLVSADELQIKMAQGSKPGEGGQLPGHKVTAEIAGIRHATPGVTLISPPPHHDIYSIEDLAQLIFDLRQINPRAVISVKLVAQAGIGTIAAGVTKAGADVIHLSGTNGGTGASPLSSIKYAGIPWELGLAEVQSVLSANGLRGRVRVRIDGGLRTGRDVVVAALLGADEFSFGTAAVVAEGCVMARACHLNTCPTGIATQRPELRGNFKGTPEQVMAFMLYVAQEVREVLAGLGAATLDDVIGRADWLRPAPLCSEGRAAALDLSRLLAATPPGQARRYLGEPNRVACASELNEKLMAEWPPLADGQRRTLDLSVSNCDRTVGARLAGEIARQFGDGGLPNGSLDVTLAGSAGQSFGAFGVPGLNLTLRGEANDYVGKGLAGGRIVIYPSRGGLAPTLAETPRRETPWPESAAETPWPETSAETPQRGVSTGEAAVLAGNTALYGATSGTVHIAGRAGERFAVRNSGAVAIVEGVGDHGCEYMTGGLVICLGSIGYNFAAGMTGGLAFVLDDGTAAARINPQLVRSERLDADDEAYLGAWIAQHAALTGSPRAQAMLADWPTWAGRFLKVTPKDQPEAAVPLPVELLRSDAAAGLSLNHDDTKARSRTGGG